MLSVLVSPEIDNIGFGSHGHVRKSENHANDGFLGSPQKKLKMKQNNYTELSGYSFNNICSENNVKIEETCLNHLPMISYDFHQA